MKKRSGKIIFFTILTLLLVFAAAGGVFWYLPHRWEQQFSDYMLSCSHFLRAEKIRAGSFNKFELKNIELLSGGNVLLKAGKAQMVMDIKASDPLAMPPLKYLELDDCDLNIDCKNGKYTLNGMELRCFMEFLAKLSLKPDKGFLPLKINTRLYFNRAGSAVPTDLSMLVLSPGPNTFKIDAEWKNSPQSLLTINKWQAFIDLNNNTLNAITLGDCSTDIFKQFLRSARMPQPAVNMLKNGKLNGKSDFSANLKNLQFTHCRFHGTASDLSLQWYGSSFTAVNRADILFEHSSEKNLLQINKLQLAAPFPAVLDNIKITNKPSGRIVKIETLNDLRQTMSNFFCRQLNIKNIPLAATDDPVTGWWDTAAGSWQLNGKSSKLPAGKTLAVQNINKNRLLLVPDNFSFKASGRGNSGKFEHHLEFSDLEYQSSTNTIRAAGGTLFAAAGFGKNRLFNNDTLEFNLRNFYAETAPLKSRCEIPAVSGVLSLQVNPDGKREINLISNGQKVFIAGKYGTTEISPWQCTLNGTADEKYLDLEINNLDLTTDSVNISIGKQKYQLQDLLLVSNGKFSKNKLQNAAAKLNLKDIQLDSSHIRDPEFSVKWDPSLPLTERFSFQARCKSSDIQHAALPGVKQIAGGILRFNSSGIAALPEKVFLQSSLLKLFCSGNEFEFADSVWQFKPGNTEWDCKLNFSGLKIHTAYRKNGIGTFSAGDLNLKTAPSPLKALEKLSVSGTVKNPAWSYNELAASGEDMQCKFEYHAAPQNFLQCSYRINNANLVGRYFTVVSPLLDGDLTRLSGEIKGLLKMQNANISNASGDLELRNTDIKLPFSTSTSQNKQTAEGTIKTGMVRYCNQNEGEFSGKLLHSAQLAADGSHLLSNQLKITGKLASEKFAEKPFSIECSLALPPQKSAIKCSFDLPEAQTSMPFNLKNYLKTPFDLMLLRGTLAFNGALESVDGSPVRGSIAVNSINSSWQTGELNLEGVTAGTVLNIADNSITTSPHNISAGNIIWRNWQTQYNDLNLSLSRNWQMHISGWKGKLLGGSFQLTSPLQISTTSPYSSREMQFDLQSMPAGRLFRKLGIDCIESDALLAGSIKFSYDNQYFYASKAALNFKNPAGRLLAIKLKNPASVRMRDLHYRDFALAILQSMKCYRGEFDLSAGPDIIEMRVKADGAPARAVPFVYQGRGGSTPFRPAQPGEEGFDGELELNVNLKLHPTLPGV